jgi:hypothetical protein
MKALFPLLTNITEFMKDKLARILGVSSQKLTDDDLLEMVRQMRFELDAKMGYVSASLIEKLKREGAVQNLTDLLEDL